MKVASLKGPRQFELKEVADPDVPADGLLLQVKACGICGSDIRRWKEGPLKGSGEVIPGHEAAGVVIKTGPLCSDFSVGDRLAIAPDIHCGKCYYCQHELYNLCDNIKLLGITPGYSGGFAEKMVITKEIIDYGIVNRIPSELSYEHAAVSEPCSSVLATHDKAGTKIGQTVVIIGAGPIGCLHVSVAKYNKAKTIICEQNKKRQELAGIFEPDFIIDSSSCDPVSEVRKATDGIGADIVICANPVAATQQQGVEMVRKGGKVMLFGGLPKADPMTHLDGNRIHYGEIEVIGTFSYHPKAHKKALEYLEQGILPAEKLITHKMPLEKISEGYEIASSGQALKVIITIEEK